MPNLLALISSAAGAGRFVADKPALTHSAYGEFTITNYSSNLSYAVSVTSGTASISSGILTMSSTDATATITVSSPKGGSLSSTAERKAYTYYYTQSTTCTPNCRAISGNCFDGSGSCQGDGSCAADGTICCGGSQGSTCTTVTNGPYKNATPSGYSDDNSEWWKTT